MFINNLAFACFIANFICKIREKEREREKDIELQ